MADKIKLALAVLLVIAGLAGYYYLSEQPLILRVAAVLAGIVLAAALAWLTAPGKQFLAFSQEAVAEARKVVWPTRKETVQTTFIVFVLVVVMGVFLWIVDWGLLIVVQRLMGRSE
jgi:preprotein translocase subunit SecE